MSYDTSFERRIALLELDKQLSEYAFVDSEFAYVHLQFESYNRRFMEDFKQEISDTQRTSSTTEQPLNFSAAYSDEAPVRGLCVDQSLTQQPSGEAATVIETNKSDIPLESATTPPTSCDDLDTSSQLDDSRLEEFSSVLQVLMSKIYKTLALLCHPDKNPFKSDQFQRLQKAHTNNNVAEMLIIAKQEQMSINLTKREHSALSSKINESIMVLKNKINDLKNSYAWVWCQEYSSEQRERLRVRISSSIT